MSIDGGVAGGAGQVLVLPVGDVEVGLRVPVLLGKTKVDDIDLVTALANSHQEIVRFNVAVDEVAGVDVLDTRDLWGNNQDQEPGVMGGFITYQLISKQQNRLEREFAVAEVEEVLEGRTKEVDDHCIVVTFGTEPPDEGDADATGKRLVDLRLVLELRMLGLDRL